MAKKEKLKRNEGRGMSHAPRSPDGGPATRSPVGSPGRRTSTAKSGMSTAQRKRAYGAMIDRY